MKGITRQGISLILVIGFLVVPGQAGTRAVAEPELPDMPYADFEPVLDSLSPLIHTTGHIAPATDLPRLAGQYDAVSPAFDGNDVGGMNHVSPVRNRGACGACYAFSAEGYTFPVSIDMTCLVSGNSYISPNGTYWEQINDNIGIHLRTTTSTVDVGIMKDVLGDYFGPNNPITFTLVLNNQGTSPAAGVVVTDIVPTQVVSTSVDSTVAVTATGTQDYVWEVAPIGVGQTEVISIYGKLAGWALPGESFVNEATIWDPQDLTPGNNWSSVIVNENKIYIPVVANQYPPLQNPLFYSTGDAGIMQGFPDRNEGAVAGMWVGYQLKECLGGNAPKGGEVSRSLIMFDVSTIPVKLVEQATLQLYFFDYCGWIDATYTPVTAYRITESWVENTVTWNNQPQYAESYDTISIPIGKVYTDNWYELDITGLVNAWLQGVPNYGVMLRGHEFKDDYSMVVAFNQGETASGPKLSVEFYGPTQ